MTNKPALRLTSDLKDLFEYLIHNLDETLTIIIAHRETLKDCAAIIKILFEKYMKTKL